VRGIIFVIRNGLRWRDAPSAYGPRKAIYSRFFRWNRLGVFKQIFAELAAKGGKPDRLMMNATHPKGHRTAASLLQKRLRDATRPCCGSAKAASPHLSGVWFARSGL
jgi:transposase